MRWKVLFLGILIAARINASCLGGIYVYPEGNVVTQNPIFLLDLFNVSPLISQNLASFDFKIISKQEGVIPTKMLDVISLNGFVKQVLFCPMRPLQISDTIFLQIKYPPVLLSEKDLEEIDLSFRGVRGAFWTVLIPSDTTPPSWDSLPITWSYYRENPYASDAPNQIVFVHFTTTDTASEQGGDNFSLNRQKLVLVRMGERRCYFVKKTSVFSIYSGICRTDFMLEYNTSYQASLTLMDFSGNSCGESRLLNFNTFLE